MGAQGALFTLASPGESFCTVWRFQRGLKKEKSPYDMVASPLFPPYLPVLVTHSMPLENISLTFLLYGLMERSQNFLQATHLGLPIFLLQIVHIQP